MLYIYSAASDTPVTSYKVTALTAGQENPWPIEADSLGMMPQFWLADGSYRARATSADGSLTYYDIPVILALGASSGSGGGSTVDPNAIFQTGDVIWLDQSGTRAGWVRDNGRTIGSATSGASERANLDCQPLFLFGWAAGWSVVGGAGASAAADWASNKKITLPDKRGYMAAGLDDMGNSAASRFSGVPFSVGDAITAGSLAGENTHTLSKAESPTGLITFNDASHSHFVANNDTGNNSGVHTLSNTNFLTAQNASTADAWNYVLNGSATTAAVGKSSSTATGASITDNAGGGAHNNMPLIVVGSFYRKL